MNKVDPKVEILVVEHKPSFVNKNKYIKSIQVGTELTDKRLAEADYFDNTGDNISAGNKSYCELTAIYWMWKNLDLDYYGLWHYRRYMSFAENQGLKTNDFGDVVFPDIEGALPQLNITEDAIKEAVSNYDMILPQKHSFEWVGKTIHQVYNQEHFPKDLDFCLDYIEKNYPDIAKFNSTLDRYDGFFCNMFVLRKDIFNGYCEFLFDVLGEFEKNTDLSDYSPYQLRVTGFLAERLTSIYFYYLLSLDKYKSTELQVAYFENTEPEKELVPFKSENNIALVLASSNSYVPYLSVLLHSIANNSNPANYYDINILHTDFTAESMRNLTNEFSEFKNFRITFRSIQSKQAKLERFFLRGHFTLITYFRLFIQDVMMNYDKVLYLDNDMIVRHDIAELFSEDIEGYLMGAVRDPDTAALYNGVEPDKKYYMDNVLRIEKPFDYFQAGTILFNLKEMRASFTTDYLIEFAGSYEWELLDQDVLNYIGQGRTKLIDMSWNVMFDWKYERMNYMQKYTPAWLYDQYVRAHSNPKIIHYAAPDKPWHIVESDWSMAFWKVARQSIYYEVILSRLMDSRSIIKATEVIRHSFFKSLTGGGFFGIWLRFLNVVAPEGSKRRAMLHNAATRKRVIQNDVKK